MALPVIEYHQKHPVGKVSYRFNEGLMIKAVSQYILQEQTDMTLSLVVITVIVLQSHHRKGQGYYAFDAQIKNQRQNSCVD